MTTEPPVAEQPEPPPALPVSRHTVNRADPDYCTLCRQLGPCVNCDMNHARWAK
jgi:hypothetical protein